jgi:hypothetical protein
MSAPKTPLSTEEQRTELVSVVLRLVKEWQKVLDLGPNAPRAALQYFSTRSTELAASARKLGLGGIAHHLEGARVASEAPIDVHEAGAALENVREISLQVRDEVGDSARRRIDREAAPSAPAVSGSGGGGVAPPRFLTGSASNASANQPMPVAPPPPVPGPLASGADATLASAKNRFEAAPNAPEPARQAVGARLNMQVRTMLGLRAFGRSKERAKVNEPPPGPSLLGLGSKRPERVGPSNPPPLLSSPLPPLRHAESAPSPRGEPYESRERPRERDHERERSGRPPRRSEPLPREANRRPTGRNPRDRARTPALGYWLLGFAAIGLAIVFVVAFVLLRRSPAEVATTPAPSASVAQGTSAEATPAALASAMPRSRLLSDDEQFQSLLSQVHGHGGKESPELRGLLDEQAAVQSRLLKAGKCEGAACADFDKARGLLVATPSKPVSHRRRPTEPGVAPTWAGGLRMPEGLPVEDDPLVKRYFQQYAENRVGRETLQSMLFRCGSYRDLIRSTLIRYDVPEGVLGLVLVESGCEPMARSPVGALGLFQFMPDSGRSYGLRIIDNVLDERLSQTKSTEAGVRFLSDLYAKLKSWDLVFASYNLGPFGLLARLHKAGDDVGFWDLVDADMLPDETAQYVPRIEALALILANLQHLKFAGLQMRSPEDTSDLEVPSGTRLGLIARAASMSFDDLRRLNRDILADRTPNVPSGRFVVQVPATVVEQARETLGDLIRSKDDEDMCVPPSFDWGRQRFTPEMVDACRKRLSEVSTVPATPVEPAAP